MERPERRLEVWGGVECTVNRVGDRFIDQLALNGHASREDDIRRFGELGLHAMRYPFLWERVAPEGLERADWAWCDRRLALLAEACIRPIAGLLHHGSGPRGTDLLDPGFPRKFAAYAGAFARRFPEVRDYTPINEPLTTARFSALYGIWYPHRKDEGAFVRALLNECKGTVLAMRAIREVNPEARLIQTDDLGRASGTPRLQYQVAYENERRFLGFDLLCGRVTRGHPLWDRLLRLDFTEAELLWFSENPCPPDIIGINHYLLSNRHLDERMEHYPAWSHGGNQRDSYADVEAIRVGGVERVTPASLLREAWERYRLPLAITEVHLDSSRDNQLRWLMEVWRAAQEARADGIDVRAVTAWGLLGHFDWNSLVTCCDGYYEPGVFDLRASAPRPTALASALRELSARGHYEHPVLEGPGWWERPSRVRFGTVKETGPETSFAQAGARTGAKAGRRPLLITGGQGTLAQAIARACEERGLPYRLTSRSELDIADSRQAAEVIASLRPWAVINAAGYVRVDDAEREPERCYRENSLGPEVLADACERQSIPLVTFSSDLVFDGRATTPYLESSSCAPLSIYGLSKARAESAVGERSPRALIIRTSAFFGPWDRWNFLTKALARIRTDSALELPYEGIVSPTYLPDLTQTSLNLLIDGAEGLWHLSNQGELSWRDLACLAARRAGHDPERIVFSLPEATDLPAPRPPYSVLSSERASLLPPLEDALARYLRACN